MVKEPIVSINQRAMKSARFMPCHAAPCHGLCFGQSKFPARQFLQFIIGYKANGSIKTHHRAHLVSRSFLWRLGPRLSRRALPCLALEGGKGTERSQRRRGRQQGQVQNAYE